MTEAARRTRGVQTGPCSRNVIDKVIEATIAELDRVGYAGLTIDAVARLADVNRTTIYRRWPRKRDLLVALLDREIARLPQRPAAASLADMLAALLDQLARNLATREGRVLAVALMSADAELLKISLDARRRVFSLFESVFRQAMAHGELPPAADVEMMAHLAFYGSAHWVLERGGTLPARDRTRLISAVLAAGAPPGHEAV